jgi:uncharacterized membrane protein YdjX (TVP38/TMEM64 family)
MSDFVIEVMQSNQEFAYIISIFLNVLISILAVIPSLFLTAANIYVFGFWEGTVLSLIGEVVGCMISFKLYRMGFKKFLPKDELKGKYVKRLHSVKGTEAFILILSLRLLPFVPSGLVNIGAAFGKVSLLNFSLATLIGKVPALLFEAFTVYSYLSWASGETKVILTLVGLIIIGFYFVIRKSNRSSFKFKK